MALNFPNSPSLNDTHTHNGLTWVWNGSVWEMQGSGGASVTVSDNAPSSPTHGDMWWESDTGDLKIYYDESETGAGSGAFWVSANGADSMVGISTSAPTNPQTGDLWWDSDVAALYMYYNDGNSSQWVSAASGATGAQGAAGAAGAQGVAGAAGAQGAQGTAGTAGGGATGVDYDDNVKVRFGDDNDMEQFFDGTRFKIQPKTTTTTSQLDFEAKDQVYIASLNNGVFLRGSSQSIIDMYGGSGGGIYFYHNGNSKLKLEGGNWTTQGNADWNFIGTNYDIRFDASDSALEFEDNAKAKFGGEDGLEIYDNGTVSVIQSNNNNGRMTLEVNNGGGGNSAELIQLRGTGNLISANFRPDSGVQLYGRTGSNSAAVRLETNSTGVDITGNLNVDGVLTYEDVTNIDSVGVVTARAGVKVPDSQKIFLGTGDDLQIYHNTVASYIDNTTPVSLAIRQLSDNADIVLQSDNGSGGVTDYIRCDGSTGDVILYQYGSQKLQTYASGVDITGKLQCDSLDVDGNVDFDGSKITFDSGGNVLKWADNVAAYFGTGNDLRIFHNGSESVIHDAGTGQLKVRTDTFRINNAADSETLATFTNAGNVSLYYDNSKKLETTSSGVTVTGGLQSQRLIITDNGATSPLVSIRADDSSPWALTIGNDTYSTSDRGISFYQDNTGNGYMRMRGDNAWVNFYLQLNDGTTTNTAIHIDTNRAVNLKYQNVNKLQTKSDGIDVTGEVQCDSLDVDGSSDFTGEVRTHDRFRAHDTNGGIYMGDTTGGFGDSCAMARAQNAGYHASGSAVGDLVIGPDRQKSIVFGTSSSSSGGLTGRCRITGAGHFEPMSNNSYDLGGAGNRWRNIYTNDLNLSNEGSTNDVDGTWGNYTIQEGENDLYLINRRNGKKYKFNLTEVN